MRRIMRLLALPAAVAVAALTTACGTERIAVPKQAKVAEQGSLYHGAVLFSERCGGCHTISFAGTHGSAPNIRDAQGTSGPNFDQRCERPIDRILYAIENGGFSGAYMPQNVVVGQDAVDVARFVAVYSGREAPKQTNLKLCENRPIGSLPKTTAGLKGAGTLTVPKVPSKHRGHSAQASTGAPADAPASAAARVAAKRSS